MGGQKEIVICIRNPYLGVVVTFKGGEIYLALFESFNDLHPVPAKTK